MAVTTDSVKPADEKYSKILKLMIDEPTNYNKIMSSAAEGGHMDIVKLMLEKGANNYNLTMQEAAYGGHMDIVNLMLEKGANNYNSAMLNSALGGHMDIVKRMLEKGANAYNSAMGYAAFRGYMDIVTFLKTHQKNKLEATKKPEIATINNDNVSTENDKGIMDNNIFRIYRFELKNMVKNPSILIIGKRGTGKSYCVRDILYHQRHIPGGLVIAPTDKMCMFYKDFFPNLYIHHNDNEIKPDKILERQSIMIEKRKSDETIDPSSILIMDDTFYKKKDDRSEILMNARHYCLATVFVVQIPIGIPCDVQLNFDYIFLLREDSIINKKKIYENYGSIFSSFEAFEKVFDKCTKDYGAMVIDNRKPANKIQEKVFHFRAKKRNFVFGNNELLNNPDYLFDYFVNKDKIQENEEVRSAVVSPIVDAHTLTSDEESNEEMSDDDKVVKSEISKHEPNSESFEMSYKDSTYQLSIKVTNPNHEIINVLCDHIIKLKETKMSSSKKQYFTTK